MKWIKHFSNAHNNLKFQPIIEKYGWVGYAWYWILLELVAEQGTDFRITGSKGWIYHSARLFELSDESLKEYLDLLAKNKLISRKALSNNTLYIPKMKEYADEYTKKVRSKSGVTPDKLPLEQNRTDKIRIDKKTLNGIVDYFFKLKKWDYEKDKKKIIYGKYVKPAKDLYELCDSDLSLVKKKLDNLCAWAKEKNLEWTLSTAIKRFNAEDKPSGEEDKNFWDKIKKKNKDMYGF